MARPIPGNAGFGGLLRRSTGDWLVGLYGSIGTADCLMAELAALYFGLSTAWDSGERRLKCYSDSSAAIKLVKEPLNSKNCYAAWISGVQELLLREWEVDVVHTLREGNAAADFLAKQGAGQMEKLVVLRSPPEALQHKLREDAILRIAHLRA